MRKQEFVFCICQGNLMIIVVDALKDRSGPDMLNQIIALLSLNPQRHPHTPTYALPKTDKDVTTYLPTHSPLELSLQHTANNCAWTLKLQFTHETKVSSPHPTPYHLPPRAPPSPHPPPKHPLKISNICCRFFRIPIIHVFKVNFTVSYLRNILLLQIHKISLKVLGIIGRNECFNFLSKVWVSNGYLVLIPEHLKSHIF